MQREYEVSEARKQKLIDYAYEYPKFGEQATSNIGILVEIYERRLTKVIIEKNKTDKEKRFLRLLFNQSVINVEKETGVYKFTSK